MSTIPLAKGFKHEKLNYPVLVSEKLDGVPVKLTVEVALDGSLKSWYYETRQGEAVKSCYTVIRDYMVANRSFFEGFPGQHWVVGELYQTENPHAPFKDTSGIVRREVDAGNALSWAIFDYCWVGGDSGYHDRMTYWYTNSVTTQNAYGVMARTVYNEAELMEYFEDFMRKNPKAEGMVARSCDDTFNPGKRSWGYQKMLYEPTIDLHIIGFEEAKDGKTGEGKGMVGRLVASYKGGKIGIGPGKLTHKERTALWQEYGTVRGFGRGPNRIAEIKYKADDSYDALRQPTFQHWRDDKETPDA